MTYSCYILESEEGRLYIGITTDIERRIKEHNSSLGNRKRFTNKSSNWKLIHLEVFENDTEARKREKQIKSWKGGQALKALLKR